VILCEFFIVAATVFSLWPGICTANGCFSGDATAAQNGISRLVYETVVLGTMALIIAIGVVFWAMGRSRQTSDVPVLEPSSAPKTY
jgi:membrane protein DedA with SNARE-associated domain